MAIPQPTVGNFTSLSELNLVMTRVIYRLLSTLLRERWSEMKRVIFCPIDDQETHFSEFIRLRKEKSVTFPLAAVVRGGDIEIITQHDSFRVGVHFTNNENAIRGKPVSLKYDVVIYDDRYLHLENLFDKFILHSSTSGTFSVSYPSKVLMGERNRLSIRFDEQPSYGSVPGSSELRQGSGPIYTLNLSFQVDTMLGEVGNADTVKSVKWSMSDLSATEVENSLLSSSLQTGITLWGGEDEENGEIIRYRTPVSDRFYIRIHDFVFSGTTPPTTFSVERGSGIDVYTLSSMRIENGKVFMSVELNGMEVPFPPEVQVVEIGGHELDVSDAEVTKTSTSFPYSWSWSGEELDTDYLHVRFMGEEREYRRLILGQTAIEVGEDEYFIGHRGDAFPRGTRFRSMENAGNQYVVANSGLLGRQKISAAFLPEGTSEGGKIGVGMSNTDVWAIEIGDKLYPVNEVLEPRRSGFLEWTGPSPFSQFDNGVNE